MHFEYSFEVSILGIAKSCVFYGEFVGWETGIEPATFGATDRRSTRLTLLPTTVYFQCFAGCSALPGTRLSPKLSLTFPATVFFDPCDTHATPFNVSNRVAFVGRF